MVDKPGVYDFMDGNGPVLARKHPEGGGWVAESAGVSRSAFVGPNAKVYGNAKVLGNAVVKGNAQVRGNGEVRAGGMVSDSATVEENGIVEGSGLACGDAVVGFDTVVLGQMGTPQVRLAWGGDLKSGMNPALAAKRLPDWKVAGEPFWNNAVAI